MGVWVSFHVGLFVSEYDGLTLSVLVVVFTCVCVCLHLSVDVFVFVSKLMHAFFYKHR